MNLSFVYFLYYAIINLFKTVLKQGILKIKGSDNMYKIMVVEDDETISNAICKYLTSWNYELIQTTHFDTVMEEFNTT